MTKDRELLEAFKDYWTKKMIEERMNFTSADIDSFLATLPEEKEEKWISVKAQPPKKDDRYLVIITYGERREVNISVWLNRLNGFDSFLDDFITHWMPLPEFNPLNK